MDDLIKRSAVIDVLKETGIIQDNDLGHLVVDEIERIPTAYDVEKVVEQLDNRISSLDSKNKICMDAGDFKSADKYADKMCEVIEIKEIVRKGGVE